MKWKPISANHREQPTNRGLKSFRQWKVVEQKRSGWPRLMVISDRQSIGNENFEKFFVKIAWLANGVDLLAAKGAFCNLNVSGLSSLLIYRSFEFQMILLLFFKQERLSIAFPVINNWPLWWKRSDWKSQIETLNRLPSDRARSKDTATRISISAFFSKVWTVFTGYCPGDTVPIERQDWPECELDQTVSQKRRSEHLEWYRFLLSIFEKFSQLLSETSSALVVVDRWRLYTLQSTNQRLMVSDSLIG